MKQFIITSNNFTLDNLQKKLELFDDNLHLKQNVNENTDIFDFEKFKNDIKNIVIQLDFDNDINYMDNIMQSILEADKNLYGIITNENKENLWGECKLSYDLGDIRYELIYIDPKIIKDRVRENHLGSLLTYEQLGIFGPCVIIGTRMYFENDKIKYKMVDITIDDIFKILVNKIIVKGLLIRENEISNIFISTKKNILNKIDVRYFNDCIDRKINGFNYYCYQNTISKDYINIIATKLFNMTIYNDIILFMEKENIFLDINIDIFEKSLINNNINFILDEKVIDYITFLNIFLKKNNNCICNNKLKKVFLCSKCYNITYCSTKCQENNWNEHQKICY
jgi:hypothetical protein